MCNRFHLLSCMYGLSLEYPLLWIERLHSREGTSIFYRGAKITEITKIASRFDTPNQMSHCNINHTHPSLTSISIRYQKWLFEKISWNQKGLDPIKPFNNFHEYTITVNCNSSNPVVIMIVPQPKKISCHHNSLWSHYIRLHLTSFYVLSSPVVIVVCTSVIRCLYCIQQSTTA